MCIRDRYRIELSDLPVIKRENEDRMRMGMSQGLPPEEIPLIEYTYIIDQYWHFQMLSPDGRVLTEYDTPYEYKSHPYIYLSLIHIFNVPTKRNANIQVYRVLTMCG